MGTYYNPEAIKANGTHLSTGDFIEQRIDRARIQADENDWTLVAVLKGFRTIAADVTDRRQFRDFLAQYSEGRWGEMDLYGVPKNKIEDCGPH